MAHLSKDGVRVLMFLKTFYAMYHVTPTLAEIAISFNRAKSWAQYNLRNLIEAGYIETNGRKRGITLTKLALAYDANSISESLKANGQVGSVERSGSGVEPGQEGVSGEAVSGNA